MIGAADVRGKGNVVNRVGQGWESLYQLVQKFHDNSLKQYVCRAKLGFVKWSKGLPNIRLNVFSLVWLYVCMRTEERAEVSYCCLTSPTFQGHSRCIFTCHLRAISEYSYTFTFPPPVPEVSSEPTAIIGLKIRVCVSVRLIKRTETYLCSLDNEGFHEMQEQGSLTCISSLWARSRIVMNR